MGSLALDSVHILSAHVAPQSCRVGDRSQHPYERPPDSFSDWISLYHMTIPQTNVYNIDLDNFGSRDHP